MFLLQAQQKPHSGKKGSVRFIDLVEMCTFGQCFAFSDGENVRSEIDAALLNIAYKISLDYKEKQRQGKKKAG